MFTNNLADLQARRDRGHLGRRSQTCRWHRSSRTRPGRAGRSFLSSHGTTFSADSGAGDEGFLLSVFLRDGMTFTGPTRPPPAAWTGLGFAHNILDLCPTGGRRTGRTLRPAGRSTPPTPMSRTRSWTRWANDTGSPPVIRGAVGQHVGQVGVQVRSLWPEHVPDPR